MFTFSGTSIKTKLATTAVVAAGALALPAMASAQTASGCNPDLDGSDCVFVGGTGHNAATDTGGATQFRINSIPNATVVCTDSRATVATHDMPDMDVDVTLQFAGCSALGGLLPATAVCTVSNVTVLSADGLGNASGTLTLSQNNCTINVAAGACIIQTSDTPGGQSIDLSVTGATGAGTAQITAAITNNTDALTFSATGGNCGIAGVPTTGTATFSNSPNSGPIVYDEVPSTSGGGALDVT